MDFLAAVFNGSCKMLSEGIGRVSLRLLRATQQDSSYSQEEAVMLAYFVVSKNPGNIIRATRHNIRPADSVTVTFLEASRSELDRYKSAHARGQNLINIANTASRPSSI